MLKLWWKLRQMKRGKTRAMVQTRFTAGVELDRAQGLNTCKHTHTQCVAGRYRESELEETERKTGRQALCTQNTPLGLQLSLHGYGGVESRKRLSSFPLIPGDSFIPVCLHSLCLSVQNSYSRSGSKSRVMEKIPSGVFLWALKDLKVYFI